MSANVEEIKRKKQYLKFLKAGKHSKHNNKPSKKIFLLVKLDRQIMR